jgi:hypothetical protein
MRETEVTSNTDDVAGEFKDKDGNLYTHSDMYDEAIFEAIDCELNAHGLELLVGDYGSSDYFFCIVKRKEE